MSAYVEDQKIRCAEMSALDDDLRRIRACCLVDRMNKKQGVRMTPETYERAVNYFHQLLRGWKPQVEATYKPQGSVFENLFAETSFRWYLETAAQESKAQDPQKVMAVAA